MSSPDHIRQSVSAWDQTASGLKGYAETERGNASGAMNVHQAAHEWWGDAGVLDNDDEMFRHVRNWNNTADAGDAHGAAATKVSGVVVDTMGAVRSAIRA